MQVTVRYFASVREAIGHDRESVQTSAPDLAGLRNELIARGGAYEDVLGWQRSVRMALAQVMCDGTAPLADGAEVAFFPPVTGG